MPAKFKKPIRRVGKRGSSIATFKDITERAPAEGNLKGGYQELSSLYALLAPVSQAGDLTKVLDDAVVKVMEITAADAASIRLLDEKGKQFVEASYRGFSEEYRRAIHMEWEKGSIAGEILDSGEALIAENLPKDKRIHRGLLAKEGFKSAAYLPLKSANATTGIMILASREPARFNAGQTGLLTAIAHQLSASLENARLFNETERRAREITALNAVTTAVSATLNLDEVLENSLHASLLLTGMETGYIQLLSSDSSELILKVHRGISPAFAEQLRSGVRPGGKTNQIIATKKPVVLEHMASAHPGEFQGEGITAAAWVPITSHEKVLGIVCVATRGAQTFSESQIRLLESIGASVGVALEKARLFTEAERRRKHAEALREIGLSLTSTCNSQQVLQRIAEEARRLIDAMFTFVVTPDKPFYRFAAVAGDDKGYHKILKLSDDPDSPYGQGPLGRAIRNRKPVICEDVPVDPLFAPWREVASARGIRSLVAVPLLVHEQPVGALLTYSPAARAYDEETIGLLNSLAAQAAATLANVRLFEEVRRKSQTLESLIKINRDVVAVLDREVLLPRIAEEARKILKVDSSVFRLLEGECLMLRSVSDPEKLTFRPRLRLDESISGKIVRENRVVAISNVFKDPLMLEEHQGVLRKASYVSFLGVPLRARDHVIGTLNFYSKDEREFQPEEIATISAFADQAAIAIENANFYHESLRQAEIQKLLKELSQDITLLDLENLFKKLTERVREFFRVDIADVRMMRGDWQPMGVSGIEPERLRGTGTMRGRSKWIFEHRKPLAIADVTKETGIPTGETTRRIGLRGYLAVPLFSRSGSVLGVLRVLTYQPREFTQEEVDLLQQLANGAAIALENAKLYQESRRKEEIQQLLKELSQDTTALDIDSLAQKLTAKIGEFFKIDVSDIMHMEGGRWRAIGVSGIEAGQFLIHSKGSRRGRSRWIVENRKPLLVADISKGSDVPTGESLRKAGIRGYAGIPLFAKGGEVIGILRALSHQPREFTQEEVDLLQQLANGAALALENARLFRETEQRANELAIFQTAASTFNQSLDLQTTLQVVLDAVLRSIDADAASLRVMNANGDEVEFVADKGFSQSYLDERRQAGNLGEAARRVLSTSEVIVSDDLQQDPLFKDGMSERAGFRSTIYAPIVARDKVLGILHMASRSPHKFRQRERDILVAIGQQIGAALDSVRLFQETERRAQEQAVLNEIAMATSQSLDLKELLQTALDKVLEVTERERGYIRLKDPVTGELTLSAHRGISEEYAKTLLYQRTPGGKSDQVFKSGEPLVINDPEGTLLKEETRKEGNSSIAWIPLKAKEKVVGILNVSTGRPVPFSPREVELLQAIGHVVGVALENARLFEETKLNEEYLRRTRDHLENIFNSLDREMFWSSDPRSETLLYLSQGTENIYGISREAFSTSPSFWKQIVHPEDAAIVEEIQQEIQAGKKVKREYRIIRPKTAEIRWVQTRIIPVTDESGKVTRIDGLLIDVTDTKQAEEVLAQKAEELARSNTELQHFAYIASHDLQEPLRMVAGYTQLLAKRYKDKLDSNAKEFIDFAVDGVVRMQALINALLAYSRIGTKGKEFEPTDMKAVLEYTLTNLRAAIQESGVVVTHDPLPTVMGDSTQLGQLLQNLIGNAIKFRGKETPHIHLASRQNGNEWLFALKDNGIGIDPQYAERIFVIFQRLHNKQEYPGTGIGLALCKKIVERHGGRIWVESQPGEGATFYFTLPV